jgi:trans-2,3-dihydro-3-hydroxyanthranilate isomerase
VPSPRSYRYRVVDVFTTQPLEGNPLAAFPEASGLDDVTMQKIAREMNLSETVFVVPATRASFSAGVRIFTPTRELPFAGHPTVGTSFVLLDEGIVPAGTKQFVLEEKVGPVAIRVETDRVETGERPLIWLTTPPISYGRTYDRLRCAQALGVAAHDLLDITPQWLSAGNPTIFIALTDKRAVDDAWFDSHGLSIIKGADAAPICVFVFTPVLEGAYSRMFAPEYGVPEDPATGSSTGPLAAFMIRHRLVSGAAGTRFVSEQGTKMGRRSILYVELHGEGGADGIDVGGYVTPVAEGTLKL